MTKEALNTQRPRRPPRYHASCGKAGGKKLNGCDGRGSGLLGCDGELVSPRQRWRRPLRDEQHSTPASPLSVLLHPRLMSVAHLHNDSPGHRRSTDSDAPQEVDLPPFDPTTLRNNSPYRYDPHNTFMTSTEEVRDSQPPTYHRVATSSQVALDSRSFAELETPPYRSRVNLGERDEKSTDNPVMPEDEKAPLKAVHYPSDLGPPPGLHRPVITRIDSDAPSVAGTDEENEEDSDYDWSDEEDLVEEEAKFEERMGKKQKPKGWGPRRYASTRFYLLWFSPSTSVIPLGLSPFYFPRLLALCSSLAC